jgi:hypothetical protein
MTKYIHVNGFKKKEKREGTIKGRGRQVRPTV